MSRRKLFVTTALPYANGAFHIGHIMEYIQADIWVRFQRMNDADVNFVCADDAHGAAITIAADKAGVTPQAFVAEIAAGRKPYLDGDLRDEGLRREARLLGGDHDRRAVGVVGADEMHLHRGAVVTLLHALEPHPDVGLDVLHHVTDVERRVGVGQGGGDK